MLAAIAFYCFAAVTVASAVMVISARNPVHSVLFLILAFFNAAGLFVLIGAEFIAMILVVVYVGAVAVLFFIRSDDAGYRVFPAQRRVYAVSTDRWFNRAYTVHRIGHGGWKLAIIAKDGKSKGVPIASHRTAYQYPCDWENPLHRLHIFVPGCWFGSACCDDWCDCSDFADERGRQKTKNISASF